MNQIATVERSPEKAGVGGSIPVPGHHSYQRVSRNHRITFSQHFVSNWLVRPALYRFPGSPAAPIPALPTGPRSRYVHTVAEWFARPNAAAEPARSSDRSWCARGMMRASAADCESQIGADHPPPIHRFHFGVMKESPPLLP